MLSRTTAVVVTAMLALLPAIGGCGDGGGKDGSGKRVERDTPTTKSSDTSTTDTSTGTSTGPGTTEAGEAEGDFALVLPSGWTVTTEEHGDGGIQKNLVASKHEYVVDPAGENSSIRLTVQFLQPGLSEKDRDDTIDYYVYDDAGDTQKRTVDGETVYLTDSGGWGLTGYSKKGDAIVQLTGASSESEAVELFGAVEKSTGAN